jgi:hypothetical protein
LGWLPDRSPFLCEVSCPHIARGGLSVSILKEQEDLLTKAKTVHIDPRPLIPAKGLGLILLVVSTLGLILCLETGLDWVAFVLSGTAVLALVLAAWPWGTLGMLIAAGLLSHFYFLVPTGGRDMSLDHLIRVQSDEYNYSGPSDEGWKVRPDHLIVGATMLAWFLRRPLRKKRLDTAATRADFLVAGFLAANWLSSLLLSPDPRLTLRWAFLLTIAAAPYFLVRFLGTGGSHVRRLLSWLLIAGILEACLGLVCFGLHKEYGTVTGMQPAKYEGDIPALYGTLHDSNSFGEYTGACAAMFLALLIFGGRRLRYWYGAGLVLTTIAMAVSMARSCILAFSVAACCLVYLATRTSSLSRPKAVKLLFAVGASLVVSWAAVGMAVSTRLTGSTFSDLTVDSSYLGRASEILTALPDIAQHPILGNGTGSYAVLTPAPALGLYSIENIFVSALHDTGFVGLTGLLVLIVFLYRKVGSLIAVAQNWRRAVLAALAGASLFNLIAFQMSPALLLTFPWITLGLLVSMIQIVDQESKVAVVSQ